MFRSVNDLGLNIQLPLGSQSHYFYCPTKNNKNCSHFHGVIQVWMAVPLRFCIDLLQILFDFFRKILKIITQRHNVFGRNTDVNFKISNLPFHDVNKKHSIISTISVKKVSIYLGLIFNFLLDTKENTFVVSRNNVNILFNFMA